MITNQSHFQPPTKREYIALIVTLALWLGVTATFIGFRVEHPVMALLIATLFIANKETRRFVVALLPFALFGISYDWMNLLPNYEVNPIDVGHLYALEKSWFGITGADGMTITPNEWCRMHTNVIADFLSGIFYLCWVPVPIAFGIGLYFTNQRPLYLRFALAFLLTNWIGFSFYYVHPAAPPWYVMLHGFEPILGTPGDVAGLGAFDEMTGLGIFHGLYARNSNVFAALPSLHSAYMVVTFVYATRAKCPNWLRTIFAIIMLGIWATAIYTAHHYVIDVITGALTALAGIGIFEFVSRRSQLLWHALRNYTKYISK